MAFRRSPQWSLLAVLATGLLSVGPRGVQGQSSNVVCLSSFSWMDNSKNQNPCAVAAYLQSACTGGQFTVDSLPNGTHYTGPYADQSNQCQCSSVTYNTISACGLCQNRTTISWSSWDFNCTTVYPGVFPPAVPDGTAIPQWAFQDVTTSNNFNVTLAQSVGDNPESTASAAQSTAFSVSSSAVSAAPTGLPSGSTSSSTSSGSKTNTAAIAGGVVGGVVGVALIAGIIVFFVMRRRSQTPPAQFSNIPSPAYSPPGYSAPSSFSPQMTQPKLYDPSDPSTFPTFPPPATVMTGSSGNVQGTTVDYSTDSVPRNGTFSGLPEI